MFDVITSPLFLPLRKCAEENGKRKIGKQANFMYYFRLPEDGGAHSLPMV